MNQNRSLIALMVLLVLGATKVCADDPWNGPRINDSSGVIIADGQPVDAEECLVRFADEIDVPALDSGRVTAMLVKRNDPVLTGNELGRLDDRTLRYRHHAAKLRLQAAEERALDEGEIRYARLALDEARVELEASRSIQADAGGAIPETRMRQLRLAVDRAELEVVQAKKRKQRAEVEAQLREADLGLIQNEVTRLRVNSPIDGVVLEVLRSPGEWIEKGETLVKLGQIDRLHVHALIRGDQLSPQNCRGLPVSVQWTDSLEKRPHVLRGRVLSVDPQALSGGRYRVHAEIENRRINASGDSSWLLTPGVKVRMRIHRSAKSPSQPAQVSSTDVIDGRATR